MELVKSGFKGIMEECKRVARDHGLSFRDETLEFMTTNEDMIRLSPKGMIPTLYDYWVHDVEVLADKGKYDLYPHNPYETVVNTRPPVSFYNDNNPDWLNVMIFYHVIGHIDFFQNNVQFARTWGDDFLSAASAHAATIRDLRHERGRWVDYAIEFARGVDNLVNYHGDLAIPAEAPRKSALDERFDWFFDDYLQRTLKVGTFQYLEELDRANALVAAHGAEAGRAMFLQKASERYVDFSAKFERRKKAGKARPLDVMEYLIERSPKLQTDEHEWMKTVLHIVRATSLYFQPQIRTKILNEGWASYWHEKLFLDDPRMRGHEIEFSKVNAGVVSLPRVGMNPYAVGLRLFKYLEAKADRGMLTHEFERIRELEERKAYDLKTTRGLEFIFDVRRYFSDDTAIRAFVDQDFCNEFRLFVTGRRLDAKRRVWQYYVKSRKAADYQRKMLDNLYHPPHVKVDEAATARDGVLRLVHAFEGKELVREYIGHTMLGIEQLWGAPVELLTHEVDERELAKLDREDLAKLAEAPESVKLTFVKVRYRMEDRRLARTVEGEAREQDDD